MRKTAHGFTIFELLIVISIFGILFALGLARYMEFNRRQLVAQAAKEFKANLRLAQNKALSGEKDTRSAPDNACKGTDGVVGTNDDFGLLGWYVDFSGYDSITHNSYQIYGQCGPDPNPFRFSAVTYFLNSQVEVPAPRTTFRFKPLGQGMDPAGPFTYTFRSSSDKFEQKVTITQSGEIY